MEFKKLTKGVGIASTCILFISLIFTYLYKEFGLLDGSTLDTKVFPLIFIICILALSSKFVIDIKDDNSMPLNMISVLIELAVIVSLTFINATAVWPFFLLAVPIISTTLKLNRKYALGVLILSGFIIFGVPSISNYEGLTNEKFLELSFIYIIHLFAWFVALLLDIQKNVSLKVIEENKNINEQLVLDNLSTKQELDETKRVNEGLEAANQRLETTNHKLNKQVAEFYTLQQISQAIATILDIKELLNLVNDVIVGVMGVYHSSILLLNEEGKLDVKITNIVSERDLKILKENLDCELLSRVTTTGKPILDNNADQDKYPFIKERDIHSVICIPLSSKNENYGLVVVEQKMAEAFTSEHLKILSIIGSQTSVALENVSLYEKMQKMATTDGLTKIYNRLYFNERISKEMAKADQSKYPMAVSIFDIDHFKKFNDTYGHLFGDKVLKTIAKLGKDCVRETDIIARYGGEEFVILMPNTTLEEAREVVENLRIKISECHVKEESISASVTASFGISCYPIHGGIEAEVLSAADTALYKAKMDGRNCTRVFEESMREK